MSQGYDQTPISGQRKRLKFKQSGLTGEAVLILLASDITLTGTIHMTHVCVIETEAIKNSFLKIVCLCVHTSNHN